MKTQRHLYLLITVIAFTLGNAFAITLEQQFEGLLHCDQLGKLKGIYFEQYSQQPNWEKTPYIAERQLTPCEVYALAVYCIVDEYYGLKVEKIAIPHLISTYAIYFKADVSTVKRQLDNYMTVTLYDRKIRQRHYPTLIANPDDANKAILFCDFTSGKSLP